MAERLSVECLACGEARVVVRVSWRLSSLDGCPHCGFTGWAPKGALTDRSRMRLSRRPVERRRLYGVP